MESGTPGRVRRTALFSLLTIALVPLLASSALAQKKPPSRTFQVSGRIAARDYRSHSLKCKKAGSVEVTWNARRAAPIDVRVRHRRSGQVLVQRAMRGSTSSVTFYASARLIAKDPVFLVEVVNRTRKPIRVQGTLDVRTP